MKTVLTTLFLVFSLLLGGALFAGPTTSELIVEPTNLDPLTIQEAAEAYTKGLEAAEAELSKDLQATFSALEESIRQVGPKLEDVRAAGEVLNHWRALVHELRVQGEKVLASQQEFVGSASTFADKLSQGPAHFRAVSAEFQAFANEESYSELAQDYRRVAGSFETLAYRCERELERVKPSIEEYRANLGYIERSVVFLRRFEQALAVVPDLTEFDRLQTSLSELSHYVRGFERLRGSLRAFDERLHGTPATPEARRSSLRTRAVR